MRDKTAIFDKAFDAMERQANKASAPRAPETVSDGHPGHLVHCTQDGCKRRLKRRRVQSLALAFCDSCGAEEAKVTPAPKLQVHLPTEVLTALREKYGDQVKPKRDSNASFVTALLKKLAQ